MSFSQSVKEEILNNIKKMKGCCATSFLTAVLKSIGSICVDNNGYGYSVETDNGDLLMFSAELSQWAFGAECSVFQIDGEDGKSPKFMGRFDVSLGEKLNLVFRDGEGLHISNTPSVNLAKPCCRRAFVQGLFLSCGSASIPEVSDEKNFESAHSNYHLELRFSNAEFANFVQKEFAELDFRQTVRKSSTVLYLKDSEKIADFFVYVDAVNAKFTVENVIIGRSYRNNANRQRNCIESNIDKTVNASEKHLAAIAKIRQAGKFALITPNLQEIATLREQNPEANLSELATILGISKSGVNHRLAKLLEIAEDL